MADSLHALLYILERKKKQRKGRHERRASWKVRERGRKFGPERGQDKEMKRTKMPPAPRLCPTSYNKHTQSVRDDKDGFVAKEPRMMS